MEATVTIYRYYFKSIEIKIDPTLLKGLTKEEIAQKLMDEEIEFDSESVHNTGLEGMDCTGNNESDRFDIFNDKGDHIYGGHL